jgi:hypothetical protein
VLRTHYCRKNLVNKILLGAQTLIYTHTVQHFDTEGGWSAHGNEESSKEAREEGGQEEEVVAP